MMKLEYQFSVMLKAITGMKFKENYEINNGEYILDFYLKDILIVEYEQKHDEKEIRYCRDWLANQGFDDGWRCPVIVVEKGKELGGLNKIVRHLAGFECFKEQYNYKMEVCNYRNR